MAGWRTLCRSTLCRSIRGFALCCAVAAAFCVGGRAQAQVLVQRARSDLPAVTRIAPCGVQPGRTVEVTVAGERLEGLSAVLGPPGVRLVKVLAVEEKLARLELEVAADVAPGVYPFHLLAKAGLSNPRLLRIDELPQTSEIEDNNSLATATLISAPVGVNGVLTATDVDHFRFEVAAGQTLVFDAEAHRIGSALQPVLTLFDAAGRTVARAAKGARDIAPDVRLSHTFASSGTYYVRVHDLVFAGGEFAVYHLRVGAIAFASSMFPLGGRRGTKTSITLSGGNLTQPVVHEVDLTSDIAWRSMRLSIAAAAGRIAAPASFAAGDLPEFIEHEPNDEPAQANRVDAPVTINGRIDRAGDRDLFQFHFSAGSKLNVRVLAQELGSPVDSVVTISDAKGTELLSADDRQPVPREPPLVRALIASPPIDDVLAEFIAPAEGDYWVAIEDRFGFGGPAYGYRLELAPARPDFELLVQPGTASAPANPNAAQQQQQNQQVLAEFAGVGTGSLSLDRGGSGSLVVRAFRSGYDGPIALTVEDLPPGVQAAPALIAAGQNDAAINFTADFEAASTAGFVRIVGTGQIDGAAPPAQVPLVRAALQPIVTSALPMNGAVQQELGVVALGISQQGAELALRCSLAEALVPGGRSVLGVAVKRREGYAGDVAIQVLNLPTGLTAEATSIAADRNESQVLLGANLELSPGRHAFLVEGKLTVPGKNEPIIAAFPLQFEVLPLVALELAAQQVDVPQGSSATIELAVRRNAALAGAVELTVSTLPKGLTVAATSIPADAQRFSLVIEAAETATASPIRRIIQVKAKVQAGNQTLELPALRFALKVTKKL
ncbi:MAG TPA: hypothetical protein VND64_06235 [Pirellulales bacterium]|nr:hypothetical protein [Pirellulales bacterium]